MKRIGAALKNKETRNYSLLGPLCLLPRLNATTQLFYLKLRSSSLSIYISAVSYDYDVYRTIIVINLINNAVLSDSEPPQPHNTASFSATCRTSVFSKRFDLFQNPPGHICGKGFKLFSGRSCECDFVHGHLRSF